ncbi:predicted protein [Nematostella vectensis]|uniref:G-protein coupled receptors family 1 profile domain-containing protein n=1 Tax=Nematostella vectensis TaxID=45351 RepID=A7S7Q4_NEMVE|nr:predicted protein [Nematostella vectensis]|eukprot:XP_001632339.1 predicted protein [Nematostella vectensis]
MEMNDTRLGQENRGIFHSIYLTESIITIVFNFLALAVFHQKTFRLKKSNYFLTSLTIADLLTGLTLMSKSINFYAAFTTPGILLFIEFANDVAISGSLFSLTLIALERVYAVVFPLKHRLLRAKHYSVCIAITWLFAFLFDIPVLLNSWQVQLFASNSRNYNVLVTVKMVAGIVALMSIMISYLVIWIKLTFPDNLHIGRVHQTTAKMTQTLFIVTLVSYFCFSPILIGIICKLWFDASIVVFYPYLVALTYVNSFINFIVYALRIPEFRKTLCKILTRYGIRITKAHPIDNFLSALPSTLDGGQPVLINMKQVKEGGITKPH